jgi:hypothetical protein
MDFVKLSKTALHGEKCSFQNPRCPGTPFASKTPMKTLLSLAALLLTTFPALAQQGEGVDLGNFKEIPFSQLSDRNMTPLGQAALAIRSADWKHAESTNFIYHFFHGFVAAPVSVEAEFYYKVIAQEMQKDTTQWERKSHIFIFEQPEDWAAFQKRGSLDPWTGGIHSGGSLFIQRNPQFKFKDNTLGHEITHLVVDRFFGSGVPLWLNEGYAEYASLRCYAAFNRARGYLARPKSRSVPEGMYIPVDRLAGMMSYPQDVAQVSVFYNESERLVRFLSAADKHGFNTFFEAISKGNRFETALSKGFGSRFMNLDALDREFKVYAIQDHGSTTPY